MKRNICIGTRGSRLALYQAEQVKQALNHVSPDLSIEIKVIKTEGDERLDLPLPSFGGKGVFTKAIEDGLLDRSIDLAVHSSKDMATVLPEGLGLMAVLKREDPRDCFLSTSQQKISELKAGARIGTSSVRRTAQLKRFRSDLEICDVRGNVETRIQKMKDGEYDGLMMATSGVRRLGLEEHITQILEAQFFIPACAQGAIGIEARLDDPEVVELCALINDENTEIQVDAERMFLYVLEGGCQIPCGCLSEVKGNQFEIRAGVWSKDGKQEILLSRQGVVGEALDLAKSLGEEMLRNGAKELMR